MKCLRRKSFVLETESGKIQQMINKKSNAFTMKEADGPTSYFVLGKDSNKMTLKQKFSKFCYECRKRQMISSIKANPHSIEELIEYIKEKWGYSELDKSKSEYRDEYRQLRLSFLLQYKPELLGKQSEYPKLKDHSEESIKLFMEQVEHRQKAAEQVSAALFDIDLYILTKSQGEFSPRIIVEKNFEYIGSSASGNKKDVKKYRKEYRDIYEYYGVSQSDIDQKTKRYETLISVMTEN